MLPMLFEPGQYLKRSVCAGMYAGMYAYVVCMCVVGEVWWERGRFKLVWALKNNCSKTRPN